MKVNHMTAANDYLNGKKAYKNLTMREAVEAHYRGEISLKRSEDWFYGFQDAADDARWSDPEFLMKQHAFDIY